MKCNVCKRSFTKLVDIGRVRIDAKGKEIMCRACFHDPQARLLSRPLYSKAGAVE